MQRRAGTACAGQLTYLLPASRMHAESCSVQQSRINSRQASGKRDPLSLKQRLQLLLLLRRQAGGDAGRHLPRLRSRCSAEMLGQTGGAVGNVREGILVGLGRVVQLGKGRGVAWKAHSATR